MRKEDLQHQEVKSPDTPMGRKYYSGGTIRHIPAPNIHETGTLTPFRILEAKEVRKKNGATTNAMEITLKIDDDSRKDAIAKQMQPGLVFAFEPKNSIEMVEAVEKCLTKSPQEESGSVVVPVRSAYMMTVREQAVPKRDVLAGLIDLSRPTERLVERLAELAEAAGRPLPLGYNAAEIAQCYSVPELLQYEKFKGLATLEDLYANQPPMMTRPYTISDFNREEGTVNILISGVSATIAEGDPLGIKSSDRSNTKDGGTATDMMMGIATGGKGGAPDGEYRLNGYLVTDGPKLVFPGFTKNTEALEHAMTVDHGHPLRTEWFHGLRGILAEKPSADTTLYFLATGSGMAPYMSLLRDLSRQKQENPDFEMPCKIVLINGGRHEEDELYPEECRQFVRDGLVETYHAASSSTGQEKVVTLNDGELCEQSITREQAKGGRYYIQDVLEAAYDEDKDMEKRLREGKARVYVCGTQGALAGVMLKWPAGFCDKPERIEANKSDFLENPNNYNDNRLALQHTASVPSRFFNSERGASHGVLYFEPKPVGERPKENPADWKKPVKFRQEALQPEGGWGARVQKPGDRQAAQGLGL